MSIKIKDSELTKLLEDVSSELSKAFADSKESLAKSEKSKEKIQRGINGERRGW